MKNVKGLILKTVAITVAAIVLAVCITYLVFYCAFPKKLARFYDDVGNDKIAVKLMDGAYEKSGDQEDLLTLCTYAIKTEDNGTIAQYLGKLFADHAFYNYCENVVDGTDYYNFFASKYIVARFLTEDNKAAVVDVAFEITENYVNGNGIQAIIVEILDGDPVDTQTLDYVYNKMVAATGTFTQDEEVILQVDMANLRQILNG